MDITRRALLSLVPALLLSLIVAACGDPGASTRGSPTPSSSAAAPSPSLFPATVIDFQGTAVVIPARPERIVSIGPSNTEYLFALGAGDRVVGVDDFSDQPAAATSKARVGGVKVNVEKVIELRADLVISLRISDGSLERIAAQGIPVVVVDPSGLADAARSAVVIGTAIGADGQALARSIDEGLAAVRAKAMAVPPKRVFHEVDASDPTKLYTAGPGSFIHDLIELAGGINVAAGASSPFPQFSTEEVIRSDPEVIVLGDAAYGVSVEQVLARPGWSVVTAVKNGRVVPVDANLMHRPGPRIVEAAEAYLRIVRETP